MLYSNIARKHHRKLAALPALAQASAGYQILLTGQSYREQLLKAIREAKQRIYLTALYIENDVAGEEVMRALYQSKTERPELEIVVFVDWHRAKRGRIGEKSLSHLTNAEWYCEIAQQYPHITIPIYGVPVNTREVLGVLHLKGSIVDDTLFYSGASINNVYLYKFDKYRIDRYHLIKNAALALSMVNFLQQEFIHHPAVQLLDSKKQPKVAEIKTAIHQLRANLRHTSYDINPENIPVEGQLCITPLIGLSKKNLLNATINQLILSTQSKLILCTPYFNLPAGVTKNIIHLLRKGMTVELIVGDKVANDFYIPEEKPFRLIGALPYLYEINLRRFCFKLCSFMQKGQLIVRLWKHDDNSYHVKGIWADEHKMLLTGHNLNPRAWHLDLENGLLVNDPKGELAVLKAQELEHLRQHTLLITNYNQIQASQFYPKKVRKILRHLRQVRIDRLINRIL